MKKMIMMAMLMAMTIAANAMSYSKAKNEALFLSDKMAYELNLTNSQYEAVYEINLDYMMSVNNRDDAYGIWWNRRNADLMHVLTAWQYNEYKSMNYFYRPIVWNNGSWTFNIYAHYSNRNRFYNNHPKAYGSYRGGNNHKNNNYYADRKVDKPNGNSHGKHGNDKASSHRGDRQHGQRDLLAQGGNKNGQHRGAR